MSDYLEKFDDVSTESKATSSSLTDEIYESRQSRNSTNVSDSQNSGSSSGVSEMFGSLEIVDSKPVEKITSVSADEAEEGKSTESKESKEPKEAKPAADDKSSDDKSADTASNVTHVLDFKPQDSSSDQSLFDSVTSAFKDVVVTPENSINNISKPGDNSAPSPGDSAPATGDAGPPRTGDAAPAPGDATGKPPQGDAAAPTKDSRGLPFVSPTEQGEVIKRDVPPAIASGGKGDSLKQVAKDHLGPGATQEEVDAHVREIARVNGIKDPDKPLDGKAILLPGHTKDGGFVTEDPEGNKRTIWHDGTVRVENTDRTGYVRHPNSDGSATIHTWGPKADQNADLIRTPDGKYRIADGPNDKVGHEPKTDTERLIAERQRMTDAADTKITNPDERAKFHKDMQAFEDRMHKQAEERNKAIDEQVKKGEITPEKATQMKAEAEAKATKELAETFKHTARILEAPDNPNVPLKQKDRVAIAEQIMHQAANPTSVDQGFHNTCNVTTIETKLYTTDPSKAAEIVANVTTTGKTEIPGPPRTTVEVDPKSLIADREARNNPPVDGQRSHASQIFEVTAVNMHYALENQKTNPPGKIRYEQHEPGKAPDTGERLMDYSTNPPKRVQSRNDEGKLIDSPELPNNQLLEIEKQIKGGENKDRILSNLDGDTNANKINDSAQLNTELARLKKEGKLPVTVMVHTDNYPFHSDGGESAGGKGGWHVVTITDYNPGPPATVQMDNQWGSGADKFGDKALPVNDLFNAMRDPKDMAHIEDLQKQIEADKAAGKPVDLLKETELLRLQRRAQTISDRELADEELRLFMDIARKMDKKLKDGTLSEKDRQEFALAMNELRDLRVTLSPAEQKRLNDELFKKMKEEGIDLSEKKSK